MSVLGGLGHAVAPPGQALSDRSAGPPATAGALGPPATVPTRCPPTVPQKAWALALGLNGRVLWEDPLPGPGDSSQIGPVASHGFGYFADGGAVYALGQNDGHRAWEFSGGTDVFDQWLWDEDLIVLEDQVNAHGYTRFDDLDAATGRLIWSDRLSGHYVFGVPVVSSNGYLSFTTSKATVQTINLRTGRTVWSAPAYIQYAGAIATIGDAVIMAQDGEAVALSASDGKRVWAARLPGNADPAFQVVDGLVLVTAGIQSYGTSTALSALDPDDGKTLWRLNTGTAFDIFSVMAAGPAGLALQGPQAMDFISRRAGKLAWVDKAMVGSAAISAASPGVVVHVQGAPGDSDELVAQAAGSGRVLWRDHLPSGSGTALVATAGTVVVSTGLSRGDGPVPLAAYRLSDGRRLWGAQAPAFVETTTLLPEAHLLLVESFNPFEGCI
jgi:outer membrane protein assembly factor BamB